MLAVRYQAFGNYEASGRRHKPFLDRLRNMCSAYDLCGHHLYCGTSQQKGANQDVIYT